MSWEPHPAAAVWPMLPEDELRALADSIAEVGLLEPIVLAPDGRLLDGRNRAAACELGGVEPTTVVYDGDPVAYVLARNDARRHMTKGQRAMASWMTAATIRNNYGSSDRVLAEETEISEAYVRWARTVHDHAPDLAPRVIAGEVSLKAAYDAVTEARRLEEGRADKVARLEAERKRITAERDALISETIDAPAPTTGPEPDLTVAITAAEVMGEPEHADAEVDLEQSKVELEFLRRLNAVRRSVAALEPPPSTDPSWVAAIRSSIAGLVGAAHEIATTVNDSAATPTNVRSIR